MSRKLRKPGWTKQSKVVTEFIFKCSFFVQTYVLYEHILGYLSVHELVEFKLKVIDTF